MDKQAIKAQKRKIKGRKVKTLRKEGILPSNIYGKDIDSQEIQVDLKEFKKVFDLVGETGLVEVKLDKKKIPVLIQNIQKDPVTDDFIHADLMKVDLKKKVVTQVPVELSGEAPAEKQGLGTMVQYVDEIDVEALPTDFPEKFELDVSRLKEVDDAVFVKDIDVDKKIEVKNEPSQILVKIEPLREEEEEPVAPVSEEVAEEEEGEEKEEKEVEGEEKEEKEEGEKPSK